ncbi:Vitamin B12-binding protein precursor [Allorhodopirellula heiligendammensis]|uniref:Vitamin B12-binding protein n=1 Tax=Allorhodopirellula heiligendammensis TaxID=2714739 RepID=A0A5C6BUH4_9BACT|nr:Vitamin B12-binding protein precursor [Allorhodopirellula heiligendammensis]
MIDLNELSTRGLRSDMLRRGPGCVAWDYCPERAEVRSRTEQWSHPTLHRTDAVASQNTEATQLENRAAKRRFKPNDLSVQACVLLTIGLVFAASGCGRASQPIASRVQPETQHVIVDRLDRTIRVGEPARRIISLSPATTELLYAIGAGSSLVGATTHSDFPSAALELPRVGGGTLESISVEAIIAAQPDLVLCKWDRHQPLLESLDRLHISTLAIGPKNLDELFEEADWLGRLTGHVSEAETLVATMQTKHQSLRRIVERVRPEPSLSVFYEVWDEPLMTAGPDSFIAELLLLAGLQNIITDTDIAYPRINAETVIRGNPDLILAPTSHLKRVDIESFGARPGWGAINAVNEHRIYVISGDLISRCGPRVLDAVAEIIVAAYPNTAAEIAELTPDVVAETP